MITDISPYLVYELGALKGERVSFCRYTFNDIGITEGYALLGEDNAFFIRIKSHSVMDKHAVYFLDIQAFHSSEIGDAFDFDPLSEGKLAGLHILKNTNRGMIVKNAVVRDFTTECGLLAEFEDETRFMIYPKQQLFTDTCCTSEIDNILDEMRKNRLEVSRSAKQDINLLLSAQ